MKNPKKLTYKEYWDFMDQIATPHALYLVPTNLEEEKQKFFDSGTYNPQFKYRKSNKKKNFDVLNRLSELEEITDVDPELSKYFIEVISAKKQSAQLLDSIGDDEKFPVISKERFGYPSKYLFYKTGKFLRRRYGDIEISSRSKELKDKKLQYGDVIKIFQKVFEVLGLDDWSIEASKSIASGSFRTAAKTKRVMVDPKIVTNGERIKKTIVHEVMTHALRANNGYSTGYGTFGRPNLVEYLDTEEGLAMFNEEVFGVLRDIDLKRRAAQVYGIYLSDTMSFREVWNAMSSVYPKRNAFDTVLRVKRGMSDTSRPGGYNKDISYLRGFLKVRKFLKDNDLGYKYLYAGKIPLDKLYLVEEGILSRPQVVPSKDAVKSMFRQIGL
jgi:hypothetical protein